MKLKYGEGENKIAEHITEDTSPPHTDGKKAAKNPF